MKFDILPWVFLALIVMVSGGIGYAADIVGRKLGKRRLTIGRLRPKHTAALGTVLLGVGVSLFTILILFVADQGVRQWILEGRLALEHLVEARAKLEKVEKQRDESERHTKDLDRQISEKTQRLDAIQKKLLDLNVTISNQKTVIAQQEAKVGRLNGQLATYNREIRVVRNQVALTKKELDLSRVNVAKARDELGLARANLAEQNKQYNEVNKKNADLYSENQRLETEADKLKKQQAEIEAKRDQAQKDLDNATSSLTASQVRLATTQQELKRLTAELNNAYVAYAQLDQATSFFGSAFKTSRYQPLSFGYREEVARVAVPPMLQFPEAEAYVKILLREARSTATQRGAKERVSNGFTYPAAGIMSRRDPTTGVLISPAQIESDLAREITRSSTDKVLVAVSSLNSFVGEPVSLEISVNDNPLIYADKKLVFEAYINGSRPEEEIINQLTQFVEVRLPQKAKADHMLLSAKTPTLADFMSQASFYALVRSIAETGRSIRVQAYADGNLRAADPLRVEFHLR